jgi:uncharacterized OB-fold protein
MVMALHPPLPVADEISKPYWAGVQDRKLLVQRCAKCERLQFPPDAVCASCSSGDLVFEEMSGRGTVFSFSETVSGARHPYFQSISPYLVGMVQLDEQEGLIFPSNFPGSKYSDLAIGAPVEVEFQEVVDGVLIPQFRLCDSGQAER